MTLLTDRRVTEEEVLAVEEIPWTRSWHPVSHHQLINSISDSLQDIGIGVVSKEYSIRNKGLDMFGVWELDQRVGGYGLSVGLRNSMAKHFALGLVAGLKVFVCTNLAFDGQYLTSRKHTGRLTLEEVWQIAGDLIVNLLPRLTQFAEWTDGLRSYKLTDKSTFKELTFDAMKKGVFPPSKFNSFLDAYNEELVLEKEENLYLFNGAVTRIMRNENLITVNERSRKLKNFLNGYMEDVVVWRDF